MASTFDFKADQDGKGSRLMGPTSRATRFACLIPALTVLGLTGAAPISESWDAVYIAGSKVGSIHTFIEPVKDRGRDLLRVRVQMELKFKRLKDSVSMSMEYGTIETLEGEVLRLDVRTLASGQEMRTHGDVIDKQMKIRLDGAGVQQEKTIPWDAEVRGPYAAEQSLSRKPIKVGETRPLKMFMPDLNRVCDVTLNAKEMEEVILGGGVKRQLLKIEQTTKLDGQARPEFDVTLWTDSGGQVLKSKTDTLGGMVTYRTTREGATAQNDPNAKFDQINNSVVKITRKIPKPNMTRDVRYKIALKGENPSKIFPNDRRQTVSPALKPSEIFLDVKTAGPNNGQAGPETVDESFLRPNAMITSDDVQVVSLARTAVGNLNDPWEKAKAIQHWVAENLRDKNFQVGFAPASEVARNLAGDCTEHGVLVAAMCRAAGVPSRVAVGLLYVETLGGFGFHLWNEVYVNRRWVAIDASFDENDVDAVHIKLSDSSLDGVSPFETFLPIVRVLGKMSIQTVEIR